MDRAFKPLRIGNGRTALTISTLSGISDFLLTEWPENRRGRKSFRLVVQAVVRASAGHAEPEVARAAFLLALEDLAGKKSQGETRASRSAAERIRDGRY